MCWEVLFAQWLACDRSGSNRLYPKVRLLRRTWTIGEIENACVAQVTTHGRNSADLWASLVRGCLRGLSRMNSSSVGGSGGRVRALHCPKISSQASNKGAGGAVPH